MTPPPPAIHPPGWRVLLGFLLAPGLAALALALVMPAYAGLPSYLERVWRSAVFFALFGAYPPALLFGVPLYLALSRRVRPTIHAGALVGAGVALAPWLIIALLSGSPDNASIDGRPTVVAGTRTLYGWWQAAQTFLTIGAAGAIGGQLFWAIAAAGVESACAGARSRS